MEPKFERIMQDALEEARRINVSFDAYVEGLAVMLDILQADYDCARDEQRRLERERNA